MLLLRPTPYSDESLESFFTRVANKNGYDDVQRFLEAIKLYLIDRNPKLFKTFPTDICLINPYSSLRHSGSRTHALHLLSQLTFNEPTNLLGLAINRTSVMFSAKTTGLIRGAEIIPRSLLRQKIVPNCPICLHEKGYASYRWHFSGYNYCHEHNVELISYCSCGSPYDYRHAGLSGICSKCDESLSSSQCENSVEIDIASWLSGLDIHPLPTISPSYRWGLIHWWKKMSDSEETFSSSDFIRFWEQWPYSFHKLIEEKVNTNFEYGVVSQIQLRAKDIFGQLLYHAIRLPDRNLRSNIILRELFKYLDLHLWSDNGKLANLRINTLEACLLLNCGREQIASMVHQRILIPSRYTKSRENLIDTEYVFHLGDIYCLWLSDFQTDEFNRAFYVSRW